MTLGASSKVSNDRQARRIYYECVRLIERMYSSSLREGEDFSAHHYQLDKIVAHMANSAGLRDHLLRKFPHLEELTKGPITVHLPAPTPSEYMNMEDRQIFRAASLQLIEMQARHATTPATFFHLINRVAFETLCHLGAGGFGITLLGESGEQMRAFGLDGFTITSGGIDPAAPSIHKAIQEGIAYRPTLAIQREWGDTTNDPTTPKDNIRHSVMDIMIPSEMGGATLAINHRKENAFSVKEVEFMRQIIAIIEGTIESSGGVQDIMRVAG
jgi:hypothetical protein